MKTGTRALPAVFVFALAVLTPAARPADQNPEPAPAGRTGALEDPPAPAGLKLILLKPSMRFEDVRSIFPIQATEETEYERLLLNAAEKAVGSMATVLDADQLEPPVAEACRPLSLLASRLARGDLNEDATEDLARLAALDERYAVLVQFLRLKTGPGASWNSTTGAITSSTASTLMQAALVSAKTGKVIWKGERLVRNKAMKPTNANFNKELMLLYRDFDAK